MKVKAVMIMDEYLNHMFQHRTLKPEDTGIYSHRVRDVLSIYTYSGDGVYGVRKKRLH